eukprot:628573-Pelagomonas_calceolata.AAC.5
MARKGQLSACVYTTCPPHSAQAGITRSCVPIGWKRLSSLSANNQQGKISKSEMPNKAPWARGPSSHNLVQCGTVRAPVVCACRHERSTLGFDLQQIGGSMYHLREARRTPVPCGG